MSESESGVKLWTVDKVRAAIALDHASPITFLVRVRKCADASLGLHIGRGSAANEVVIKGYQDELWAQTGVRANDRIHRLNGVRVDSLAALKEGLELNREEVEIVVARDPAAHGRGDRVARLDLALAFPGEGHRAEFDSGTHEAKTFALGAAADEIGRDFGWHQTASPSLELAEGRTPESATGLLLEPGDRAVGVDGQAVPSPAEALERTREAMAARGRVVISVERGSPAAELGSAVVVFGEPGSCPIKQALSSAADGIGAGAGTAAKSTPTPPLAEPQDCAAPQDSAAAGTTGGGVKMREQHAGDEADAAAGPDGATAVEPIASASGRERAAAEDLRRDAVGGKRTRPRRGGDRHAREGVPSGRDALASATDPVKQENAQTDQHGVPQASLGGEDAAEAASALVALVRSQRAHVADRALLLFMRDPDLRAALKRAIEAALEESE